MAEEARNRFDGNMFTGILLICIGLVFLADKFDYFEIDSIWGYWPFIIVFFGVQRLFTEWRNPERAGGGVWLVFLGLWLFVSFHHIWGLHFSTSWPFLIIAWGISTVWKSVGRPWLNPSKEN